MNSFNTNIAFVFFANTLYSTSFNYQNETAVKPHMSMNCENFEPFDTKLMRMPITGILGQ